MSVISRRIARELSEPEFRNTYKRARVRSKLVYQIRALRKQRNWLQGTLAKLLNKPQSTVSRFEDAEYGKLSLETLFEISDAFDVGLIVEFVSYPEFLVRTSNLSQENLYAQSFSTKSVEFLTREQVPGHVHDAIQPPVKGSFEINVSGLGMVVAEIKPSSDAAEISGALNV
jgi:transcriptional regulator with XRE-family HTH domain